MLMDVSGNGCFIWESPDSEKRIYMLLSSLDASFESLEMCIYFWIPTHLYQETIMRLQIRYIQEREDRLKGCNGRVITDRND